MLQIHQFEDQFIAVAEKIPVLGFGAACRSRHAASVKQSRIKSSPAV
jgi:hypothetical protein